MTRQHGNSAIGHSGAARRTGGLISSMPAQLVRTIVIFVVSVVIVVALGLLGR